MENFDWSYFDNYQENFVPEQSSFRLGLEALPDGPYDFEIVEVQPDIINTDAVLRVGLRVGVGGTVIERLYWLGTQDGVNALGADLCIFGFPADQWKQQGRKLGDELKAVVAKMPGIKFKGMKRSYTRKDGKPGHSLNVIARIAGTTMPATPPPAAGHGNGASAHPAQNLSDIPF